MASRGNWELTLVRSYFSSSRIHPRHAAPASSGHLRTISFAGILLAPGCIPDVRLSLRITTFRFDPSASLRTLPTTRCRRLHHHYRHRRRHRISIGVPPSRSSLSSSPIPARFHRYQPGYITFLASFALLCPPSTSVPPGLRLVSFVAPLSSQHPILSPTRMLAPTAASPRRALSSDR